MKSLPRFLYLWLPVVLWMVLIFFLSSQPTLPSAAKIWWDYLAKKSAHMFEYAILFTLIIRAQASRKPRAYALALAITFIYAVSDEYHQSLVPGRRSAITDVGYDSLGMAIAYLRHKGFL